MILKPLLTALSLCLLVCSTGWAEPNNPNWKIIKSKYPTSDILVAGYNVQDFGAQGDGREDCTRAFQNALDAMRKAGGGTVFVPEGKYAFNGSLDIPPTVTLRGEWKQPTKTEPWVQGTILMPMGGKGNSYGRPFISVDYCAGIKDMNIWYPHQSSVRPEPYPFCLVQQDGDNATFENLTLVNPYQGIRIGPKGNELHMVRNVYGTPLNIGIQYDSTTDIGRLDTINFSARWWCQSRLPKAPGKLDWIKSNGTAIHMLRSDWEYVANIKIEDYKLGFLITEGVNGSANAQFLNLNIRNCHTAMEVKKSNPIGMVFTKCYFDGINHGVLVDNKFNSTLLFSNCSFGGKEAVHSDGEGDILMEQCQVIRGHIVLNNGSYSIIGSIIQGDSRIRIAKDLAGLVLAGNTYSGSSLPITADKTTASIVQSSNQKLPLKPIPDYPELTEKRCIPSRIALVVVHPSGRDDSAAIQKAMDDQASNGGGIVLLPGENYLVRGRLNIPTGVELRGIHDVPHHTVAGGSILHIYSSDDQPTIIMEPKSGMRGLCFNYPEQNTRTVKTYPFLIQGRGADIYIVNITAANPYKYMDFMTHRCDNHYIEYPSGAPFKIGIAVGGGSQNGVVRNMQFNTHYWARAENGNKLFYKKPSGGKNWGSGRRFWDYQKDNLDALVIGSCTGEFLYQNFVYGSLYGIHFTQENGKGAVRCISHGHGTDGSKVGAFFEYGHGTITMVNSELVAMSSQNKTAIKVSKGFDSEATLINTMVWGSPDILADIGNGTLTLQNLHAHLHGKGLYLSKGILQAFNMRFDQRGSHFRASTENTKAQMAGFITNGRFQSSNTRIRPDLIIERNHRDNNDW